MRRVLPGHSEAEGRAEVIDVGTRFPVTSLREAYDRSQQSERWVFKDTVCSSVTLLYGKSAVGKSYLVSSMLLSLLVKDRDFLGMQPEDTTKTWRPVILWTDPGSDEEYGERIYEDMPEGMEAELPLVHVGSTTRQDEWDALTEWLIESGFNFVVLDNLMGVTGDTNESTVVTRVFDGLTRLTQRGVPVVVLHHESEHGPSRAGAEPMGASVIVQKSRCWVQVRQSMKRKARGGNAALVIQGNSLDQPRQIVAEPLRGPNYRVIQNGPWVAKSDEDESPKPQKRDRSTLDRNADMAAWVVDNCQGKGLNETAGMLAEKFSKGTATCRDSLMRGALSSLLDRTGDGASAVWSRK